MKNSERLRWIDLVARAIAIMNDIRNVRDTPSNRIGEFTQGISLMASMTGEFIQKNANHFKEIETAAAVIVKTNEEKKRI